MKHGGNLRALASAAGVEPESLLDFSASINPLGPPACLRGVLAQTIDQLVHYPDPECRALTERLAALHGVAAEEVVVGNGSSELFYAIARAIRASRAVVPVPSYLDYAGANEAAGRPVQSLRLEESMGFDLDWDRLRAALGGGEAVWLGHPNNPTGRALDCRMLQDTVGRHPQTIFVVDEAFADFMPEVRSRAASPVALQSQAGIGDASIAAGKAARAANLIVVRSMTKFFAIPGLRIGYAIAPPEHAAAIRRQLAPWSVNTFAQAAALAVLDDADFARRSVEFVRRARTGLAESLAALGGLHVFPSAANYLLVRIDRAALTATALAAALLRGGIAVRTFLPGEHLDDRYFRVAVRSDGENERLCAALADALMNSDTAAAAARGSARAVAAEAPPAQQAPRVRVASRRAKAIMFQGTCSNAGKSVLTAALCRILLEDGLRVAPFKSQNMSLNSFVAGDGGEMGRAQVVQAQACRIEPDCRMNPILLKPNSDTGCQVVVRGRAVGNMRVGEYVAYKPQAFAAACDCYEALAAEYDAVVLEGAGSPGEVNLKRHDIVNMRMAEYAAAPVLIVGDIDRGGVFASFVGTMAVLEPWEQRLVGGFVVNRFRGDAGLLEPALQYTRVRTGKAVLGVVPYVPDLGLPEEDSVEFKSGARGPARPGASGGAKIDVAVVDLPHISNFTDFDALAVEPDVSVRIVRRAVELGTPDAVILPGSKSTLADLSYVRESGFADRIAALAAGGTCEVIGICGGFQMLGRDVCDPLAIESVAQQSPGLSLLGVNTVMGREKALLRTAARHADANLAVAGYEIHHGQTHVNGCRPLVVADDGRVLGVSSSEGRVWGTYLHGIFDADAFRRWFIDRLRGRRGWAPLGRIVAAYDIEPAIERLAKVVRSQLQMDAVYRLLNL